MMTSFQRLLSEATRLTLGGNLQAATESIQAALAGGGKFPAAPTTPAAPAARDSNVIDVQARVLKSETAEPAFDAAQSSASAPSQGEFIHGSHCETMGTRSYKLYIPPVHTEEALPLVVMLHGCTQNPDDFAAGTEMNEAALKRGFYVLYPAQTPSANPSRCWSWFKHNHQTRGRGEPAILAGMTRAMLARYNIDPQRVYVAGLSAGGAMAAILGEAYPDIFAAVGVHSGMPTGAASNLPQALSAMKLGGVNAASGQAPPTIVFHGDQDGTVHPSNGAQAAAASAGDARPELEQARSANGLNYTRQTYRQADGRVRAEHWNVHGAGHAWSGGNVQGSYTESRGPSATQEMLRFFLAHKLAD
ncbi:esterase [Polaromonas sp.]|nr:esterase [Polaromonas sp.]